MESRSTAKMPLGFMKVTKIAHTSSVSLCFVFGRVIYPFTIDNRNHDDGTGSHRYWIQLAGKFEFFFFKLLFKLHLVVC